MEKIKLTQNKVSLVDNEDFEMLSKKRWRYDRSTGYAKRQIMKKGVYTIIYLHRVINKTPIGWNTDHINRNKLDNRKSNLRTVTQTQNMHNVGMFKTNTSGFKGVSWNKVMNKWESYIWNNNKKINLGYFEDILKAFSIRKQAELIYWK